MSKRYGLALHPPRRDGGARGHCAHTCCLRPRVPLASDSPRDGPVRDVRAVTARAAFLEAGALIVGHAHSVAWSSGVVISPQRQCVEARALKAAPPKTAGSSSVKWC
eukprot:scaffold293535_cov31-Tisochrysis_lutea.AAC.2